MPGKVQRSRAPLTIALHKLHGGQRVVADHPARFKVVMCGRRWGKTAFGIEQACRAALGKQRVGWFAPSYKYASEAWNEIVARLSPVIARKNEQEKRLELKTGGVVEVWTLDSKDPARGRKYHKAIVDEAGIVSDLISLWQQAIRPTLVDYQGDALFLGTPKGRRHGFITMFKWGDDPEMEEWKAFRAPTSDNPHIPKTELRAAQRELPPEVFAQEFEGIPMDDGVNPFGLEKIRAAFANEYKPGKVVVWGVDLARAVDYTVAIGLDSARRAVEVHRWQGPWSDTRERLMKLLGPIPAVVDATGVGDPIVADLQEAGLMVTRYVFSQTSKRDLMARLVTAFQLGELKLPSWEAWLKNELESFEFTYTATGVRYEAPKGEHDDGVIALALALHGWDRVQCVVPEEAPLLPLVGDDRYFPADGEILAPGVSGDFMSQLPGGF
jgi:hypothetical protein